MESIIEQFDGICIKDAFEYLQEGVPNTYPDQLQKFLVVVNREVLFQY